MPKLIKIIATILFIAFVQPAKSQNVLVRKDTLYAKSENIYVFHTHIESDSIKNLIQNLKQDDFIFNDTFNTFSKLSFFKTNSQPVELSTIPLEKIIILEDKNLVIGLSKVEISPYKIVIYNFEGQLIAKSQNNPFVLKLSMNRINSIKKTNSILFNCLKNEEIVLKKDTFYYYPLSNCILNNMEKGSISNFFSNEELVPDQVIPFRIVLKNSDGIKFRRLYGFYHETDPFHDLVSVMGIPYILVLNSEKGERIYIPLISNCKNPAE